MAENGQPDYFTVGKKILWLVARITLIIWGIVKSCGGEVEGGEAGSQKTAIAVAAPTAQFASDREACEYYAKLGEGGPKQKVKDKWAAQQVEWCVQLLEERDFPNNEEFTALPNMGSYISDKRFDEFIEYSGRDPEAVRMSHLGPVIDPATGEPARLWWWAYKEGEDPANLAWYEQYCYLMEEDAVKVSEANRKMYEETGKRLMFKWCFRPPPQQAIMWGRTCHSGTTAKKCKETNPKATAVGQPGDSWHQLVGFDIARPKEAVPYLNEAGFIGYCDSTSKTLRDEDKGHFYPGNALEIEDLKDVWKNLKRLRQKKVCEAKAWAGL